MSWYVMPCDIMLCLVIYVTLCRNMVLCYVMLKYGVMVLLCYVLSCHVMSCYAMFTLRVVFLTTL